MSGGSGGRPSPRPSPAPDARPGPLWAIAIGIMLVPLNSTMIAVALPTLVADFDSDIASVSWLVISYLIAMAALQPLAGKLGDRYGRRLLVVGGLLWFAAASVAAATASSLGALIFWRLQQAIAGALMFPNGIALVREIAPADRLGSRVGTVTASLPLGAAAGPPLGGLLLAAWGWHAIFLVNLPLALLPLALAWRSIPASVPAALRHRVRFDYLGAVTLTAALAALTWLLSGDAGSAVALGLTAVVVLALVFVRHELRHPDPIVEPRLFARPAFAAATGAIALSNMAMYVTVLTIPILLSREQGWSDAGIGAVLGAMFVTSFLLAPAGGAITDRFGRRLPALIGLSLLAIGLVPLAIAPEEIGAAPLVVLLVVAGSGWGLGFSGPPLQVAALEAVDVSSAGVASGVYSTSRYLGSIVGTSLLAGPLAPGPGLSGFDTVFAVMVCAAVLAALLTVLLPGRSRGDPGIGKEAIGKPAPASGRPLPQR